MSIDWSRYGVDDSQTTKSSDAKTSVDFSKYHEDPQPTMYDKIKSGALPNPDITQSPLLKQVQAAPHDVTPASEHPIQDWIAEKASGIANIPIVKNAAGTVGDVINKIENLPVIRNIHGALAGADNTQVHPEYKSFIDWNPSQAVDLLKSAFQSGVEGFKNPEQALQRQAQNNEEFTKDFGPVSKFLYNTAVTGGTDPLSYLPFGAAVKGGKFAGTKIGQALDDWKAARNPQVEQQVTDLLSLPPGRGEQRLNAAMDRSNLSHNESPIAGTGNLAEPLALPSSSRYDAAQQLRSEIPLALPESQRFNRLQEARQPQPYGNDPIAGQGNIADPLALPQGNYVQPQRLKVTSGNQTLDYVMNQIKPEVEASIAVPTRRDQLITYIQDHLQIPREEIHNMPMSDLQELGQHVRDNISVYDKAVQAASKRGYDLPSLLEGQAPKVSQQVARNAQERIAGVYPDNAPKVSRPESFNRSKIADAQSPKQLLGSPRQPKEVVNTTLGNSPEFKMQRAQQQLEQTRKLQQARQLERPIVGKVLNPVERVGLREATQQPILATPPKRNFAPSESVKSTPLRAQKLQGPTDELKFAQTVKESSNTPPDLLSAMNKEPITGARTTDVLNHKQASELIKQHGVEGLYGKLMSKKVNFSPSETVAAEMLAKHYGTLGGDANLSKAIDLVAKTGKGGREMGQAIQALSVWNKLDESGVLMLGTKQLNKGVEDISKYKSLTTEQAKPLTAAAQRYGTAEQTKNLADEVLSIVTNKAQGEALTESEKVTIKQFQDQVKLINEKGKGILPQPKGNKANATIKEVSQIEPKARTRDQVVSFLDAKAEQARQRIAASRNIGFAAINQGNPIIDHAIIGASYIAKGVVKLSDFTEQMVKDFGESIKPHINEIYTKATNMFNKENGLPTVQELDRAVNGAIKKGTFTEAEAHQFKAWATEIGHMSDEFKLEATQDLQKAMNEIGTSTLGQKLSTIQTSAQLLSLPTAIRNVVGNEAFNVVEKINKVTAIPIDWTLSKMTGERSIVFKSGNQEKYWSNFIQGAKSGWKGVSPNGQFAALDIHPEAFKSDLNPFKYLQKATGSMLQSFDHAAYMRAYGTVLGEYSKITGKAITELDQSIHELADEAGRYATFQDDTFLSKLATGTKRLLNKPTDLLSDALVNKGVLPEGASLKGFGMGDLILKYAKTPANIVMRGIDYSPIGIMRGMGELLPLLTKKEFNQRQAVLALSRGITGTLGMTGLGYALTSAGILTGSASGDADIRSLDQQTGKGEYKVNWSALERYITGGLDKNAAQWQKGDRIFDWGWLQPMAISIAMGVNAQQSVAKQKSDGTSSYVGVAKDALVGSLKTIMQQPLLQGVQSLVSGVTNVAKYGSWTGIANIFKGAPASFVPALSNQARNFTDNTSRNTYDPSALKEALNMVINRIPGLDKKLPIAYDTLGNQKEQIQGGQANTLSQGLKSFASPVKMTNYTVSPEAKMIIDLINSSGDTKAAPRSPNKYLMVDKKKVSLTPDQYSQIQQQTGKETQKQLAHLAPMLANPNIKDENKVKEVVNVLDKVGQKVRNDLNRQYPEFRPLKTTR